MKFAQYRLSPHDACLSNLPGVEVEYNIGKCKVKNILGLTNPGVGKIFFMVVSYCKKLNIVITLDEEIKLESTNLKEEIYKIINVK